MWTTTETSVTDELGQIHKSYGIKCNETSVNDLSFNKDEVDEFVEKLNRLDASEIHAVELARDFIER